jgi:hypothetical protein
MRTVLVRTIAFLIAALCAAAAWGQTPAEESRVLSFKHAETAQQLQEIANLIGAITVITNGSQLSSETQGTLTMRGTAEQVKLAEWLAKEIDNPGDAQSSQQGARVTPEYVAGNDDVVRMLRVSNATTVQDFQEFWSIVRAATEMRSVFGINSQNVFAVRGTREQVRLAEWLVNEIDKPAAPLNAVANPGPATRSNPPAPEYRMSAALDKSRDPENVVRVFYLTQTAAVPEFQEVVSLVRAITECRRISSVNGRRALVVRGSAEQTGLAEFLYNELNHAPGRESSEAQGAKHEYRIIPAPASPASGVVRVFRVTGTANIAEFQDVVKMVRSKTLMRQVFSDNAQRALVARGSENEILEAEQILEDRRKQNAQ